VYLALAILSFIGIWSAVQLPISLFPNSSKPAAELCVGTDLAPDNFLKTYGESIENEIRSIRRGDLEIESLVANYTNGRACYEVEFKWGGSDDEAKRELEVLRASLQGRLPQDSRDRISLWAGREGSALILSFYSAERSMTDLYKILEPALMPKLSGITEAQEPFLYNPQARQVQIELKPEALATFQLLPRDVAAAVLNALESYGGGSLTVATGTLAVEFPRTGLTVDSLKEIQIPSVNGRSVSLGEVARIDLTVPLDSSRVFKTSGAPSVILFATAKPGGNVKAMAEETKRVVDSVLPNLPKDVQYRVLIDPSEYIRSAVNNVAHEVALAAGLAVIILFLFVGNLKNVITAAIEIPLSIVLAFILMRLSGMNLNMISLGGLALSAGMNVDASVVVMENIFRHFEEEKGRSLNFEERLAIIVRAVKEVQFSVIASTIASLVVFIPLAFTRDLSYAILGDLAKAVVFSHGFSAVVALILVPTIRLHVMKNGMAHEKPSFLEGPLQRLEIAYSRALGRFLELPKIKFAAMAGLAILFIVLSTVVAPSLKREIIGKPDTDAMVLVIRTTGNTLTRQMEAQAEQIEHEVLKAYSDKIAYTFTQVNRPNQAVMILRLKAKREMQTMWKALEEKFPNTPTTKFFVDAWNPGEMPLPNPPDFKLSVRGNDRDAMLELARDLETEINELKLFQRVNVEPGTARDEALRVRPRPEQWPLLAAQGLRLSIGSISDLTRTAINGQTLTRASFEGETMAVFVRFPDNYVQTPEDLGALPVGVGSRILPLKALAQIDLVPGKPAIRRENGREAFIIEAKGEKDNAAKTKDGIKKATELIENWPRLQEERRAKKLAALESLKGQEESGVVKAAAVGAVQNAEAASKEAPPTLQIEDAQYELNGALRQLAIAVSLSIALIFLTMVFQFGSIMNSLLVLVAVPLGFIGVVISLFVFQSTLSLNSLLGVILLNGLAVANSIILVDFLQRKVQEGVAPRIAAVEVARVRLRPILMTSLTTGLGMLPIALGLGEGGKILQPLGIAVAGGLGFSMVTTLFIVPMLQVAWLERCERKKGVVHA
jgi:multidrug efflux pump subunit AcrB